MRMRIERNAASDSLDILEENPQYSEEVATLQSLLSRGRVEEARCLVNELQVRWPESDLVRRFARVLAPPTARVVEGRSVQTREQAREEGAWLRDNARNYPGCWVILLGGQLLAAHSKLRLAIEEADRQAGPDVGSIHYIPPDLVGARFPTPSSSRSRVALGA
jgi:hypothetical protein